MPIIKRVFLLFTRLQNILARRLGTRNIVGEYGKYIAMQLYPKCSKQNDKKAGYDFECNAGNKSIKYKVKSRVVDELPVKTGVLRKTKKVHFDILLIVLFDMNGKLDKILEITTKSKLIKNEYINGKEVLITNKFLSNKHLLKIDVSNALTKKGPTYDGTFKKYT